MSEEVLLVYNQKLAYFLVEFTLKTHCFFVCQMSSILFLNPLLMGNNITGNSFRKWDIIYTPGLCNSESGMSIYVAFFFFFSFILLED